MMATNYVHMRASQVFDAAEELPAQRPARQDATVAASQPAAATSKKTMADLSPAQLAYLKTRRRGLILISAALAAGVIAIIVVLLTVG